MKKAAEITSQLEYEAYKTVIPGKTKDSDVAKFLKKRIKEPLKFKKNEFKFLPKKYCSKMTMEFFGDYTVIYSGEEFGKLKDEPTVFVIKSKDITEGFRKLYQFMWDKL